MSIVNVLAVMDGARRTISAQSNLSDDVMAHIADDVAQARAAVTELIEHADRVAATLEMPTLVKPSGKNANAGFVDMRDWYALQADVNNLRVALIRCGGAP